MEIFNGQTADDQQRIMEKITRAAEQNVDNIKSQNHRFS